MILQVQHDHDHDRHHDRNHRHHHEYPHTPHTHHHHHLYLFRTTSVIILVLDPMRVDNYYHILNSHPDTDGGSDHDTNDSWPYDDGLIFCCTRSN